MKRADQLHSINICSIKMVLEKMDKKKAKKKKENQKKRKKYRSDTFIF